MAKITLATTASFCVENARKLGIPAALLLDKIIRMSKSTPRKDGFCWYTSKQFEEETSLKKDAFDKAAKLLVEKGIVEKKNTYEIGTMTKKSHFRLLPQNADLQQSDVRSNPQSRKSVKPTISEDDKKTIKRLDCCLRNNPEEEDSSIDGTSRIGALPFDAEVAEATVNIRGEKPTSPAHLTRRRNYGVAGDVYKHFGINLKPTARAAERVGDLLDAGWKKEDIIALVEWANKDEFYSKQPTIEPKLCNDAAQKYLASKNEQPVVAHFDFEDSDAARIQYIKELMPARQKQEMIEWYKEQGRDVPEEYL